MGGDLKVVTLRGRRDNAQIAYVRVGVWRFAVDEPVYDVPAEVAEQLLADHSLRVDVDTETKTDRTARLKAADEAEREAEAVRAAKHETPDESGEQSETDEGQEG